MAQQTAVEWLFIKLYEKFEMKGDGNEMDKVLEQANKMFEEQIIKAHDDGDVWSGEKYYTKTYDK